MNKKQVVIRWKNLKTSGREAAEIIIKDLNDAISVNQDDYEFLEEMRKEFIFGIMGIEKLQARLAYPDLMNSKVIDNRGAL